MMVLLYLPEMSNTKKILCALQDELDSVDMSVVISSCSLTEARHLLDHFLKASIDKVSKLKLLIPIIVLSEEM